VSHEGVDRSPWKKGKRISIDQDLADAFRVTGYS
jgi:hypothetical protein